MPALFANSSLENSPAGSASREQLTSSPEITVIIPAHDAWEPLAGCLQSLAEQERAPEFEVIVADDGSREPAPSFIESWASRLTLTIDRRLHSGPAAARNRASRLASGAVLLFTDADCRLRKDCLAALHSALADSPANDCFQLRLTGDCSRLAGRAEHLRLEMLQRHLTGACWRINYLNTSGFAIRRQRLSGEIFDPSAYRGEDTLLLVKLMRTGELPLFVSAAVVEHSITLPFLKCLAKDIGSGCREAKVDREIASKGVRIRMSHRERLGMLAPMWREAGRPAIGRSAYFVLLARQFVERATSLTCRRLLWLTGFHKSAGPR
ncbi:MAG: glycosyltransferase family 2 protein [Terriglobia bacterium]